MIANSGWASSGSRLGRGARSRISITRSVIATMSSTAPSVSLSGLALRGRERPLEDPRDLLGGELPAARPVRGGDAEDVAEAVVADVPALGEAGDDLPGRVEPHQPLRDIGEQHRVRAAQRPLRRIARSWARRR